MLVLDCPQADALIEQFGVLESRDAPGTKVNGALLKPGQHELRHGRRESAELLGHDGPTAGVRHLGGGAEDLQASLVEHALTCAVPPSTWKPLEEKHLSLFAG